MKPSGWICIVGCWLCSALSASDLSWDSEFLHQNSGYRLNYDSAYHLTLPEDWSLNYTGSSEEHDANDRLDKTSQFNWQAGKQLGEFLPFMVFRYTRTFERNDDSSEYSDLLWERTAGLGLLLNPFPHASLRTSWSYARLEDESESDSEEMTNGLFEQTELNLERTLGVHSISLNVADQRAGYHPDRPNYDSAVLDYRATLPQQSVVSRLEVRRDNDRLNQEVSGNARQYRKALASLTDYRIALGTASLRLRPELTYDENRIDGRPEKNYANRGGDLRGELSLPWQRQTFSLALERQLTDKDAELASNSEKTDLRGVELGLIRVLGHGDSLIVRYNVQLRRTDIPDGVGTLDNDRLNRDFEVGLYTHYRQRIKLSALFNRISTEQVFIHSSMSGQNTLLRSYTLQPILDFDAGDNFYLGQSYLIRADYEDYLFADMGDNRMFRRFCGRWRWGWDESPGLSQVALSGAGFTDNSGVRDPWSAWCEYDFTVNSSGTWDENAYEIGENRFQHDAIFSVRTLTAHSEFRIGGCITWVELENQGKKTMSRRELRPELEYRHSLGESSETGLLLQPVFSGSGKPDWRVTFRLTIRC